MGKSLGAKRCVYCGQADATTRDHVFPRALFVTMDSQMITVPACFACNQLKAEGDQKLREYVNLDIMGSQHPDVMEQFERIGRAAKVKAAPIALSMHERGEMRPLETDAGIYLGEVWAAELDAADFNDISRTLQFIVRGLYFHETGTILSTAVPVDVKKVDLLKVTDLYRSLATWPQYTGKGKKGNSVASWIHYIPFDAPTRTFWVLEFNNAVTFIAITGGIPGIAMSEQEESADLL